MGGGGGDQSRECIGIITCCPQTASAYLIIFVRMDYIEMIKALTEFHINNLTLQGNLATISHPSITDSQLSLDI